MSKQEWKTMNEIDFDTMIENCVSELPPEDIVEEVTPWKKTMNYVLVGTALNAITLNFWCLNYILPTIGMILLLLGFRSLRKENSWFRSCFIITITRPIIFFPILILNTTIFRSAVYTTLWFVSTVVNPILIFAQFVCFWQGLRAVQQKVELPPRAGEALALIVWYVLICLLAFVRYSGLMIVGVMIVASICIIRSLYKLSKELDEAGYAIQTAKVKVSDQAIVISIVSVLLTGCGCGYLFGGSYSMDWKVIASEHDDVAEIRTQLLELDFPEYVLNDLSTEDIASCDGALQVVTNSQDYPVNEGRTVITEEFSEAGSETDVILHHQTVYDIKELRITGVAVQIPGEHEQWMIFQHFLWITNPGFYGTESIQLWPAYQRKGWESAGDISGRVLYDKDGETYAAPYYSLGNQTFTYNSIFWGEHTSTDIFATFSMPRNGENHRGYIAYPIIEVQDGWMTDCWFNYTHQQSWLQYPAMTAMEMQMTNHGSETGAFITVQDAFQFYSTDEGVELLGAD